MNRRWSNKKQISEMLAGGTENKAFQHELSKFSVVWKMDSKAGASASASASTASRSADDLPSSVAPAAPDPSASASSVGTGTFSDPPPSHSSAADPFTSSDKQQSGTPCKFCSH